MRVLIVLTCLLMSLSLAQSYEYNQEVMSTSVEGVYLEADMSEIFLEPLADVQLAAVEGEGPGAALSGGVSSGVVAGIVYGVNKIVTGEGSWSGAAGTILGAAAAGAAVGAILPTP